MLNKSFEDIICELVQTKPYEKIRKQTNPFKEPKMKKYCLDCGVPIVPWATRCKMHYVRNRYYAIAVAFSFLFALGLNAAPSGNTAQIFAYFSFPVLPPDFSHFTLYYGTTSSNYTVGVSTGSATNATVTGLNRGQTYYFNVTQSTTNGVESDYGTEVVYTVPAKPPKAVSLIIMGE